MRSGRTPEELIAQHLSLARLESSAELSHTERVDLANLLAEVAESADFEASAANRRVQLIICSTTPLISRDVVGI